jgi:hypothetical protein
MIMTVLYIIITLTRAIDILTVEELGESGDSLIVLSLPKTAGTAVEGNPLSSHPFPAHERNWSVTPLDRAN